MGRTQRPWIAMARQRCTFAVNMTSGTASLWCCLSLHPAHVSRSETLGVSYGILNSHLVMNYLRCLICSLNHWIWPSCAIFCNYRLLNDFPVTILMLFTLIWLFWVCGLGVKRTCPSFEVILSHLKAPLYAHPITLFIVKATRVGTGESPQNTHASCPV